MSINYQNGIQFDVEMEYENLKLLILQEFCNQIQQNKNRMSQSTQIEDSKRFNINDSINTTIEKKKNNEEQTVNEKLKKHRALTEQELKEKKLRILKALEKHLKKENDSKTQDSLKKLGLWDIFNKESQVEKTKQVQQNEQDEKIEKKTIQININPKYIQQTQIVNLCKPRPIYSNPIKICQEIGCIFQLLIFLQLFAMLKGINQFHV